jgi:malonate-semialdehyde dehydrogenase (acetylating)/methylmalonate-semialdehyde dehydrogenase
MQRPERLKYCVNNEWRESKTAKPYMPVTDSSTGAVIAEAPCCTVDEVNSAVAAAKAAFPGWSTPIWRSWPCRFRRSSARTSKRPAGM